VVGTKQRCAFPAFEETIMSDRTGPQSHCAKRELLTLSAAILLPVAMLCTLVAWPKEPSFASEQRLLMTVVALATAVVGLPAITFTHRRYRMALLRSCYRQAPSAMRDTMKFLIHECELGRRGRLTLMLLATSSASAYLLASWPQCAALAPFKPALGCLGVLSLALVLLQPLRRRRHIFNAIYLKRYLRQQAEHIGFRPSTVKHANPKEPAVLISEPYKFRVGGFEWQFDDFQKNALVVGQPGSGKTVCVLNPVLEALIGCGPDDLSTSGIIFDPKGTYRDVIRPLCQRLGRGHDLYTLSINRWPEAGGTPSAIAMNPTDTLESALEVAQRFSTVLNLMSRSKAGDTFFQDSARTCIRYSFELIRAARAPEPCTIIDILRLCREAIDEPVFYEQLLGLLRAKYAETLPADVDAAFEYFEAEWRTMPDKQLSGVRSTVTQILDDFTAWPLSEIVSGRSTITVAEIIDSGKILYIDLPLAERERAARVLMTLLRLEFQREILRRPNKPRRSFCLADEFQALYVAGEEQGDSDFFERARESNHANIIATQNMSSFLKKTTNRHDVTNFLGLCAVKIFLRNSERETNEWASQGIGERSEIVVSASEAAGPDGFARNRTSYSRSVRMARVVPVDKFTELAVPERDDPERQFAESIVQLGSRFSNAMLELSWRVHPLSS
jgi:hypothetical protein